MDYKQSGVDIEAGERAVKSIKNVVKKSYNENVLTELGSFGGLYAVDLSKWKAPVMVASTDGVGTKILVALKAGRYDTIGQDLVNHCVNDIFVQGASPQFFMDYIGLSKMRPKMVKEIITGMTKACIENEMSLIGGEMAEMPDIYQGDDFDLVGTIVGLVEKDGIITGQVIQENDVVIGFPSTGLHTNGYSLARKIVFDRLGHKVDDYIKQLGMTVSDAMLSVHRSYYQMLKKWAKPSMIHGMAHITGGGLVGNIKRILPNELSVIIECYSNSLPVLFKWLMTKGNLSKEEAYSAFNMGIGFVVITSQSQAKIIIEETDGRIIGKVTKKRIKDKVWLNFD